MCDLMALPSASYGKNETNRLNYRDLPAHKRADFTFRPEREHIEQMIVGADKYRLFSRLAPGETWRRRVCSHIGEWLLALGRELKSYSSRPTVQAPASGIRSH